MKAIVCVKQVPDTQGKVAVKADGTMDRAAMATISTKQVEITQLKQATTRVLVNQRGNCATESGWNRMLT